MAIRTGAAARHVGGGVGRLVRQWRMTRGLTQLDLAMDAGFSARHVSFIETGRTRPSREALLVLAETMDVPLRERNRLLETGGYAPVYRQTPLAADEMSHVRTLLQFIVDRHLPYAAIVLDRYANCVMGNGASGRMVAALVDPSLLTPHMNHLRLIFHPLGVNRFIVNWEQVARPLLARAERELSETADDEAAARLLAELRGYAGALTRQAPSPTAIVADDLLLPIHIRKGDLELRIFSAIMTLGTPKDVTLQELRIETFFPADAASERNWSRLVGGA